MCFVHTKFNRIKEDEFTLLMPRIVSTSSCSVFSLAFQRKSVRAT